MKDVALTILTIVVVGGLLFLGPVGWIILVLLLLTKAD